MPAAMGDACFDFRIGQVRVGNDVVVFASRTRMKGPGASAEYFPAPCDTDLSSQSKHLPLLGKGMKPHG
jgi:hypothetical protein